MLQIITLMKRVVAQWFFFPEVITMIPHLILFKSNNDETGSIDS